MTREALWFERNGEQLFAWLHLPNSSEVRGGVVICPPLGHEYNTTHLTMRQLAESLEAEGFAVLRFDYRGTGDSPGQPTLHHWVDQCQEDVRTAVEALRESGLDYVVVVGMRMGATLAAAALRGHTVQGLVLWDPCDSARTFLREQLLLQAMTTGETGGEVVDDWLDCPESMFPKDFVLDLASPTAEVPNAVRALVLTRDDRPVYPAVRRVIEQLSAEESLALGQSALLNAPSLSRVVPSDAIRSITNWIAGVATPTCSISSLTFKRATSTAIVGSRGDRTISETVVRFGEANLFGILTEGECVSASKPSIIFPSVANDHRAATGRLWVDLAREMAWFGFRSLRLDLSGGGDSDLRAGQEPLIMGAISHLDDINDAARYISNEDPTNVVLVGLSSSAYVGLESGYELGVRAVCAINSDLFFVAPEMEHGLGAMDARRRFCFPPPASWERLRARSSVAWVHRKLPQLSVRLAILVRHGDSPIPRLQELVDKGTKLLLVGGSLDNLLLRQSNPRKYRSLSEKLGGRLVTIEDLGHHLPLASDRSQVFAQVKDFLLDVYCTNGSEPEDR